MLLTAALTACLVTAPPPRPTPPDDGPICKSAETLARLADGWAPDGAVAGDGASVDVLHYELDLEILPATQWLGGSNTITARSLVDGLTMLPLRLHDTFDITAVTCGGVATTWQRTGPVTIEVQLDRPYQTDETFEVTIAYDGQPQSQGFGSINFQSEGGLPLVYTLSEPWYAYTWWPAKDDNADKATGNLSLTVPEELTVASNGALLSIEDLGDGRAVHHWSTGYQTATYLVSFSAAGYTTFSADFVHTGGTMPVQFFIFPGSDSPSNRDGWLESVDMLGVFGGLFGPYPFLDEKYGIYEFGFGGGMEHQTMTGQGGFGESLTAHELTHQGGAT